MSSSKRTETKDFLEKNNLDKATGIEPSGSSMFAKFRSALEAGATGTARRYYRKLRFGRQTTFENGKVKDPIDEAMKQWAQRPFTGNQDVEKMFYNSLTDREKAEYAEAIEQRIQTYMKWVEFFTKQEAP